MKQKSRQKVFNRGLYVCAGGGALYWKFNENSTELYCFIFQFCGLVLCLGRLNSTKPPWRRNWYVGPISSRNILTANQKLSKTERSFENWTTLLWQNCRLSWYDRHSSWPLVPSRNPSTHFYVAKLRCRQTADSRTSLAIALKLVFRFHFGGL